jgi:hypothetical protein
MLGEFPITAFGNDDGSRAGDIKYEILNRF